MACRFNAKNRNGMTHTFDWQEFGNDVIIGNWSSDVEKQELSADEKIRKEYKRRWYEKKLSAEGKTRVYKPRK